MNHYVSIDKSFTGLHKLQIKYTMRFSINYMVFSIITLFILGCSHKKNTSLEEVLKLAGKNRHELERVINHYKTAPEDSLKLKAAEFLILNMPGKYTESYDAPWEDVATVNLRWSSSSDKSKVIETYNIGEMIREDDIHHITADYLISNIELAFQVWRDKPWGKHISFETFCEEILPYRIGTEPLENWREKVLASFADLNKLLKEDSTITSVEACIKVNDILPRFRLDKDFSNMNFTQLMATTRGMCDSQAALAAFVMRGLGIPITIDFTPQWKSYPTGHSWNSVCDSAGQHVSFMGTETNPHSPHQGSTLQKAKVYRKTFKNQKLVDTDTSNTPPLFQDNIIDISAEHNNMTNVAIPIKYHSEIQSRYVFLTMFYNFEWRMTGYAKLDSDSIRFQNIGKDVLYLPVYYVNETQIPAGDPFYIDNDGKLYTLKSNVSDSLVSFSAITSENDLDLNWRMVNAVFEISQNSDFSDAQTIHTITNAPNIYNRVRLKKPQMSRYIRYRAPIGKCNVGEIVFYDTLGNELYGTHIGSAGSHENLGDTGDKAFDGDISTFYDALDENNSWTGLDFGEQKTIVRIDYVPRLKGIGIYEYNEYELFCWTNSGWVSLGEKTAKRNTIVFDIPQNTLLYFNNNTINKRGKVFFTRGNNIFFYD